jgi:hypothetical protein
MSALIRYSTGATPASTDTPVSSAMDGRRLQQVQGTHNTLLLSKKGWQTYE